MLSNNNYLVQRTGTRYTQTLQKLRLRLYAPNQRVSDVTVKGEDYLPGTEAETTHNDWYAQAWETEFGEVLFGTPTENPPEETTISEYTDKTKDDAATTENQVVKTTTADNSDEDKTSSVNNVRWSLST